MKLSGIGGEKEIQEAEGGPGWSSKSKRGKRAKVETWVRPGHKV